MPPDFKKLPVEDLIAIIADKSNEKVVLDRAFLEFHSRFVFYILKVCNNTAAIKGIFKPSEIDIIAHNANFRVFLAAGSFTPTGPEVTEKRKIKRVCGWLGTITRNTVYKYFDDLKRLKGKIILTENIDDYSDYVNTLADEEDELLPPSPKMQLLEKELAKLKERDRDILYTYLTYEDENGIIDTEYQERLQKNYGLLPKYPGKIKHRTIEKLLLINPENLKIQKHDTKKEERRRKVRGRTKKLPPLDGTDVPGDTGTG